MDLLQERRPAPVTGLPPAMLEALRALLGPRLSLGTGPQVRARGLLPSDSG